MPARSDDPLRRVTLNLYESDCQWLERTYGHGWTERVRQHIHNEVFARKTNAPPRRTLGDLTDD
jgi:hypothetical protein